MVKKSDLSTDDVCRILGSCAEHKVVELKFGNLEVRFGTKTEHSEPSPSTSGATVPVTEITDTQRQNLEKASLEHDELMLREDQLEELKITDPARYEEMIRNEELEEDESTDGDGADDEPE